MTAAASTDLRLETQRHRGHRERPAHPTLCSPCLCVSKPSPRLPNNLSAKRRMAKAARLVENAT